MLYPYLTGILTKGGYLDTEPHTKREVIEQSQGEDGHLQAKEKSLEQFLLEPSRRGVACLYLILDFWPLELCRNNISVVLNCLFMSIVTEAPGGPAQPRYWLGDRC